MMGHALRFVPAMKTPQLEESPALSPGWIHPRLAADGVAARCRQARGFQAEQDFWKEFRRIYAEAETTVDPAQRFAFAAEVDGRLARMGLAPWSIMSRLAAADDLPPLASRG